MKESNKRVIKNVEIAEAVEAALEEKGYEMDYSRILDDIDISRDPEEEEIPVAESIIDDCISSFLEAAEAEAESRAAQKAREAKEEAELEALCRDPEAIAKFLAEEEWN